MKFETINQAAKRADLPNAGAIRRMVKRHECPGFYSGSRFYVNVDALKEKLDKKCREILLTEVE